MKTKKTSSSHSLSHFFTNLTRVAILILCISFANCLNAQTKSGSSVGSFKGLKGDGTSPGNPLEIATLDQLRIVSENPDCRVMHLALVADIDATATKNWNVADHDNDDETPEVAMGFNPIGHFNSTQTRFSGSFEGNGYTISNLYIYHQTGSGDYAGLFGTVETDWYIRNVNVSNVNFTCKSGGGLVNQFLKGYVKNCHTSGIVKGTGGSLGGLIGSIPSDDETNAIDIDNCTSSCDVTGGNPNVLVSNVGGLVGLAFAYSNDGEYISITNCSASGDISSYGGRIGGLLGSASDSILVSNCIATGDVTGLSACGGLIGDCDGMGTAQVINCYSSGNVSIIPNLDKPEPNREI